jgi:taurine dioxygenase
MAMSSITVEPSGAACGATVRGVDLRDLDAGLAEEIRSIWLEHAVVCFPAQHLSIDELERVATFFGPYGEDPYLRAIDGHPHVAEIRREPDETAPLFAEGFHSDWSFLPSPPTMTILSAVELPPVGGDTLYADQRAAYDALPAERRRQLDPLMGVHSARRGYAPDGQYGAKDVGRSMAIVWSDTAMATQLHPLVKVHPETGRRALFLSPGYTIGIDGMEHAEAQALLAELYRYQVEERFVYRHRWSPGMVTMWDNRSVVHAATGGYEGHRRLLRRITLAER